VLGFAAAFWGIVMAISPALQIRRMIHHRSSRELWVAYGISIENWYLIVPNAVAFTVCTTTIAVALSYRVGSRAA
jgi:hypothetical protein